jgi:hypothetical protein
MYSNTHTHNTLATMFKLLAVIALSGAANAQWCSDCESTPLNTSCCYLGNSHLARPPRVSSLARTPLTMQRMLQCRIVLSTVEWEWDGMPPPPQLLFWGCAPHMHAWPTAHSVQFVTLASTVMIR